ncbi:MAG: HEAT repeat domain-containing protein [Gammaproteobacteria bacterium]|nr:HEAT repeat domain-containing protein [Gammaproteobacteria bacterium]
MGLRKRAVEDELETVVLERGYETLLLALRSESALNRRDAVRELSAYPQAVTDLLNTLTSEPEHAVREALLGALQQLGGEPVVAGLITLLRSEDAVLRNGAIEVLQTMPEGVALHMLELLNDRDSDVRIFAIDILQQLAHPQAPEWLLSVLKDETHINVVSTAVDRLAEVGRAEMVPELMAIKQRFPKEAYLAFAVDLACRRIEEV